MKKFLKGAMVIGATAAVAVGAALAYFSDVEISTDNSLVAGALDLKVDNMSYYYGPNEQGEIGFWFRPDLSWELADLPGHWFFDYDDLKPGDWGEDTISLHVYDNDAWVCMNVTLTETLENTLLDPEIEAGDVGEPGELQDQLWFTFWVDDGDNVFEEDEWMNGVLFDSWLSNLGTLTLADSTRNVWTGEGPMEASTTYYIAKAWCYGNMLGWDPLPQADYGSAEAAYAELGSTGVFCDGEDYGIGHNLSQSDSVLLDLEFYAEQWRHNENFVCMQPDEAPTVAPLSVR